MRHLFGSFTKFEEEIDSRVCQSVADLSVQLSSVPEGKQVGDITSGGENYYQQAAQITTNAFSLKTASSVLILTSKCGHTTGSLTRPPQELAARQCRPYVADMCLCAFTHSLVHSPTQ